MSKSLRSIKDPLEKTETVKRRLREKTEGLGYWAAVDAERKMKHTWSGGQR